jgi:hypothetical protein
MMLFALRTKAAAESNLVGLAKMGYEETEIKQGKDRMWEVWAYEPYKKA